MQVARIFGSCSSKECVLSPLAAVPVRAARPVARSVVARANPLESIINQISVLVTNSPLNEGKKRLAQMQAGEYDEAAIRSKLDKYIADNNVVVFSWSKCPFCVKAKQLLSEVGAKYQPVELDLMGNEGKAFRAELAKLTGRTSMPNIWIKGQAVGGCNDGPGVVTLQREGKLLPMLRAAGAL